MAGGTIDFSRSSKNSSGTYIDGYIKWSSTPDDDANSSDVSAMIFVKKCNDDINLDTETTGTWTFSVTINGTKKSYTVYSSVLTKWMHLGTVKMNGIDHNSDGSKSITISGSVSGPSGTSLSGYTTSGSGTAKLDTIPRASTIDSLTCATEFFTGKLTYKYTPQSASFYNRCNISLVVNGEYERVKSVDLGKKSAEQQTATVTLSSDELQIIYDLLPDTIEGTLRFTFRTYSDSDYSSQVGDAVYKEVTLRIPESAAKPIMTVENPSPSSSLSSAFSGLYIQGKTKLTGKFTAKAQHGATIKSQTVTIDGKTYDANGSFTTGYLSTAGTLSVVYHAVDSNGYENEVRGLIIVLSYSKPKIQAATGEGGETEIICARCDEMGELSDTGTFLKIKAKRSYSKVKVSGVQYNTCVIRYRYRLESSNKFSDWKDILAGEKTSTDMVDCVEDVGLSTQSTYVVELGVLDDIGESASTVIIVPTDRVYMHKAGSKRSIGVGKYAEDDNTVDIAQDLTVKVRGKLLVGEGDNQTEVSDTGWISLGLSDGVEEAESSMGRGASKTGCWYRVINGNHVYVAFNCKFNWRDENLYVNGSAIPSGLRPPRNVYGFAVSGGRYLSRIFVNTSGDVAIEWAQSLIATEETTARTGNWIDGYIDYWI